MFPQIAIQRQDMHATNVRNLKKNPSLALRQAEESPVLVLKGDEPNALIVHLDKSVLEAEQSIKPALAAALFKDGTLSLGGATRLSGMPMQAFIQYLAELGFDLVYRDETTDSEVKDLSQWLA
jgi:predicted HTH domain antitoxin